ncbi:hypothetical protein QBC34DRAFT_412321 [Podospora aff. communis PSN243]|uniref:Transporter n=1 Tax=Podospora aff. communis PSN243 TaxID=3040156 RepID=A0AAV9GCJ5_9PEZI|nr:hypothetical protein QBC34DRAFT_412321 [Podospora aff. communis PSN243]
MEVGFIAGLTLYPFIAALLWVPAFTHVWRNLNPKIRADFGFGTLAFLGCILAGLLWPLTLLGLFIKWLFKDCLDSCMCFGTKCCGRDDSERDVEAATAGVSQNGVVEEGGSTAGESMELPPYPEACLERK